MELKKSFIKKYMDLFSQVGKTDPRWEGCCTARHATTENEKREAYLQVAKTRYEETKVYPLDLYFGTDLKKILEGKDVLEIGSNYGGGSLAYFHMYNLSSIVGLDIEESQIEISKSFFELNGMNSNFDFIKGEAEQMPFPSNNFDAIVTFNVLEHLPNLRAAMHECYRVLRSNGKLLLVFSGYYGLIEHHLVSVTLAPCIHWFFSPQNIIDAYNDILDENPKYKAKLGANRRPLESWEKLYNINGTSLKKFKKIISENPWSKVQHIPLPIGSVESIVKKYPFLKFLKYISFFGTKLPIFEEFCNHRIVYILTK